ncbi:protein ZGRF1-like isoform X3 [Dreissena polymorpha]|uniref:protein ZGRF1-like isoform X3 n=1 Tax=Dreissena polymorpha TaxID=45954 RepID=UPI002264667E|nr:protein ZGRF1-like isoform X3 [Dreissena polymorpha]
MEKEFVVLYTQQKQKKAKTWHDGTLLLSGNGTKATLLDSKGCRLDTVHVRLEDVLPGEQLESDRYYIQIEDLKSTTKEHNASACVVPKESRDNNVQVKPMSKSRCAGLKRKMPGFMPPRLTMQPSIPTSLMVANQLVNNQSGSPMQKTVNPIIKQWGCTNMNLPAPLDRVNRNVINLYTSFGKDDESPSQESKTNSPTGLVLSPWSVYGSKKSSPIVQNLYHPEMLGKEQSAGYNGFTHEFKDNLNDIGSIRESVSRRSVSSKYNTDSQLEFVSENMKTDPNENYTDISKRDSEWKSCYVEVAKSSFIDSKPVKRNVKDIMKLLSNKTNQVCVKMKLEPQPECANEECNSYKQDNCTLTNNSGFIVYENNTETFCLGMKGVDQIFKEHGVKQAQKEFDYFHDEVIIDAFNGSEMSTDHSCLKVNNSSKAPCSNSGTGVEEKEQSYRNCVNLGLEDKDLEMSTHIVGQFDINFSPLSETCNSDDEHSDSVEETFNDRTEIVQNSFNPETTPCSQIYSQPFLTGIVLKSKDRSLHNLETLSQDCKTEDNIASDLNSKEGYCQFSDNDGCFYIKTNAICGTKSTSVDDIWTCETDLPSHGSQRPIITKYDEKETKNSEINKMYESKLEGCVDTKKLENQHNASVSENGAEKSNSKVMSQSQDTMEFSCDTLENESQWRSSLENVEHSNTKDNDSTEAAASAQHKRKTHTKIETPLGNPADISGSLDEVSEQFPQIPFPKHLSAKDLVAKPLDYTQMSDHNRKLQTIACARPHTIHSRSLFDLTEKTIHQLSPVPHPHELFKRNRVPRSLNVNLISSQSARVSGQTACAEARAATVAAHVQPAKAHYFSVVDDERLQLLKAEHSAGDFRLSLEPEKTFQQSDPKVSPFQRLSDSDDLLQSPQFYFEYGSVKPEMRAPSDNLNTDHDDALRVPCVTLSDLPMSPASTSQQTDEEIFEELYKPRMMYNRIEHWNNLMTPSTNLRPIQLSEQGIHTVSDSFTSSSAESVQRIINHACTLGESMQPNLLETVSCPDINVSWRNSSLEAFRRKRKLKNSEWLIDGSHVKEFCSDEYSSNLNQHSLSEQCDQSVSKHGDNCLGKSVQNKIPTSVTYSPNEDEDTRKMKYCKLTQLTEGESNFYSSDEESCVYDALDVIDQINQQDVLENSKWCKFAQSPRSDESEVDLSKYTVMDNKADCKRVFHVLDKPCNLYSTQSVKTSNSNQTKQKFEIVNQKLDNRVAVANSQSSFSSIDSFEKMLVENEFNIEKLSNVRDNQIVLSDHDHELIQEEPKLITKADIISNKDLNNEDEPSNKTANSNDYDISIVEEEKIDAREIFVNNQLSQNEATVTEKYNMADNITKWGFSNEGNKSHSETMSNTPLLANLDFATVGETIKQSVSNKSNDNSIFDISDSENTFSQGFDNSAKLLVIENEVIQREESETEAPIKQNATIFNSSSDQSFTFKDMIAIADETHITETNVDDPIVKPAGGMRIGWKPPVKNLKNSSNGNVTEIARAPFKCLQILEKAKLNRGEDFGSALNNYEVSVKNSAFDELNNKPDSVSRIIEMKQTNQYLSKGRDASLCLSVTLRESNVNRRFKPPTKSVSPTTVGSVKEQAILPSHSRCTQTGNQQSVICGELCFPARSVVESGQPVVRVVSIPATFPSVAAYKQTLSQALTEYLNTQLFNVAHRYHKALSQMDITRCAGSNMKSPMSGAAKSSHPSCQCGMPSKMVLVKKVGPNQGRAFYACSADRNQQCKKWVQAKMNPEASPTKQMLLRLPYKGHSSLYAKDDVWVISRELTFDPGCTFLARSTFHGPSSSLEVELEPITGHSPSNWTNGTVCHTLLAGNASSELSCLDNVREHLQSQSPPIVPQLLNRFVCSQSTGSTVPGFQAPRNVQNPLQGWLSSEQMDYMAEDYIKRYSLNVDQTEALRRVAAIFTREKTHKVDSVLLIHGVFGAGKSYLLSVAVLFLMEVFSKMAATSFQQPSPWKLLISSTTNVAVDRILMGLLDLGFEDFVRVGSVKKIAKPVLPYSVHASGTESQELKDLQEMLRCPDLTATEKSHIRKGIEKHRKGENKKKLGRVQVVGATCASCSLTTLQNMQFPLVLLDECSQMTEPASLLPVARYQCQKLILVGDPKQLDPTIEGADSVHANGLEQTLFDRLILMGHIPTLLRTQYRCHPHISAIANSLFYGGMLTDGVTETDRKPLLPFLPTLCYYDVSRGTETSEGAGSFYNEAEAGFVVFLLQTFVLCGLGTERLGVITLYRGQVTRINDLLSSGGGDSKGVQVSTVDAFQGGERDIIILSTVRTKGMGFIDNDKRMNVALTRACHHLLIVGHHGNLSTNTLWGKVIQHCNRYADGVQCADEARFGMEQYLLSCSLALEKSAKGDNSQTSRGDNSQPCSGDKSQSSFNITQNSRRSSQSRVKPTRAKKSDIDSNISLVENSKSARKQRVKQGEKKKNAVKTSAIADANDVAFFDDTGTEIIDKENLQKAEKAVMNVTSDDEEMVGSEENQSNCSNYVYGGLGTSQEDEDFSLMHSAKRRKYSTRLNLPGSANDV